MNSNKMIARIVGVLYIIGTVAGVLSVVFTKAILDSPDYLAQIAAHETQIILGAGCILIMGLALALVPVVMFPVLKKHNQTLALGYIVFRGALETTTYIVVVMMSLLLVTLGREWTTAVTPHTSSLQTAGILLQEASDWSSVITTFVFILGAVMFYYVLYAANLIPRWISGWGLIAVMPYLLAGFLVMFGLIGHMSPIDTILRLPLGIQEMVLAVWLIAKGFSTVATDSEAIQLEQNKRIGAYTS